MICHLLFYKTNNGSITPILRGFPLPYRDFPLDFREKRGIAAGRAGGLGF
jgi:hypothetical protein